MRAAGSNACGWCRCVRLCAGARVTAAKRRRRPGHTTEQLHQTWDGGQKICALSTIRPIRYFFPNQGDGPAFLSKLVLAKFVSISRCKSHRHQAREASTHLLSDFLPSPYTTPKMESSYANFRVNRLTLPACGMQQSHATGRAALSSGSWYHAILYTCSEHRLNSQLNHKLF